MNKIREAVKHIYKQFVCEFLKTDPNQMGKICCTKVRYVSKVNFVYYFNDDLTSTAYIHTYIYIYMCVCVCVCV